MPVRSGGYSNQPFSPTTTVLFSWKRVMRFSWRFLALSPFIVPLFVFNGSMSVDGLRWLLGLLFDKTAWETYTAWRVTLAGRTFPILPWILVLVCSWSQIGLLSALRDIIDDPAMLITKQIASFLSVYDLITSFVGIVALVEPVAGLIPALLLAVVGFIPVTCGVEYALQRAWKES